MARRKSSRKMEPVPLKLSFRIPAENANHYFIDISQCISLVSRKFLRQGLNWAIAGGRIIMPPASSPTGNSVYLSTIPHTWVASNGWHKTQAAWLEQQNEAIAESDSQSAVAKFRDFKIHADINHVSKGFGNNLLPVNMGPGTVSGPFPSAIAFTGSPLTGEWEPSSIVLPNILPDASGSMVLPLEYYLHMVGINNNGGNSRGIIDGYQSSRAYPQSPDPVSPVIGGTDNFLNKMFDVGKDNPLVLENATDVNDDLPYDQVEYPGSEGNFSQLENQVFIFNSNTIGVSDYSFKGFSAPCGLIRVDQLYSDDSSPYDMILEIELMPGDHRGYLAEPMQEM